LRPFCLSVVLIGLLMPGVLAQAPQAIGNTAQRDPKAIDLMQRVLAGLGGVDAWRSVGAATTNVTFALPDGSRRQIHWADDWSGPSIISRREAIGSTNGKNLMIASGQSQAHFAADGTAKRYPGEAEDAILAVGYPGAVLARALQDPNCIVSSEIKRIGPWSRFSPSPGKEEATISQRCLNMFYPGGAIEIMWTVNPTTVSLAGVWLPIRGMLNNSVFYEQVQFMSFQEVGNLILPKDVTIKRPTGRMDSLTIEPPVFASNLPSTVFDPKK
jgi:hypothetical protein